MDVYKTQAISEVISGNPYVGRGIIIGITPDSSYLVTAYFIMGRSENSRNRIFIKENDDLKILPFDECKIEDPSLIIYYPIRTISDIDNSAYHLIISNGDQTDTIRDFFNKKYNDGESTYTAFEDALRTREFEPDDPNWTPRISGIVWIDNSVEKPSKISNVIGYKLSILKSGDKEGSICNRFFYEYRGLPGLGHFIHTYVTDAERGEAIPTFQGEPKRIEITGDIEDFTESIWRALDDDNKISLYVRYTDVNTGEYIDRVINKNIR